MLQRGSGTKEAAQTAAGAPSTWTGAGTTAARRRNLPGRRAQGADGDGDDNAETAADDGDDDTNTVAAGRRA